MRRAAAILTAGGAGLARGLLMVLIFAYQCLSSVTPTTCRYHPSCSRYAMTAVARHGPVRGGWLAVRRLARCHPWAEGGVDPVPEAGDGAAAGHRPMPHPRPN